MPFFRNNKSLSYHCNYFHF